MSRLILLIAAIATSLSAPQANSIDRWHTLDQMCGTLVRDESFPVKSKPPYSEDKHKEIRKAHVRLYPWRADSACCSGSALLAETTTGRWGQFEFKNAAPGDYWLAISTDGHEYIMGIGYQPKGNTITSCSDQTFMIEKSGDLSLMRTIVIVD